MSAQAASRAPIMTLRDLVSLYRSLAGQIRRAGSAFLLRLDQGGNGTPLLRLRRGLSYQPLFSISKFAGEKFTIDGVTATHVSINAEIQTIL